jgi:hypothetical protein
VSFAEICLAILGLLPQYTEVEARLSGEMVPRDRMAGLKLLGGLVRLDALNAKGFTAVQLSEQARVDLETARAYLNPEKGPGYAEVIVGAKAVGGAAGRPANLYRLRQDRLADLMRRLAEARRELDVAVSGPLQSFGEALAPLDLLEATLRELEHRGDPPEAWRDRLAEAQLELGGAEADLRAMQAKSLPFAEPFALRLGELQGRLARIERKGPLAVVRDGNESSANADSPARLGIQAGPIRKIVFDLSWFLQRRDPGLMNGSIPPAPVQNAAWDRLRTRQIQKDKNERWRSLFEMKPPLLRSVRALSGEQISYAS